MPTESSHVGSGSSEAGAFREALSKTSQAAFTSAVCRLAADKGAPPTKGVAETRAGRVIQVEGYLLAEDKRDIGIQGPRAVGKAVTADEFLVRPKASQMSSGSSIRRTSSTTP